MPMMKIGKTLFMGTSDSAYVPYSALEYNGSGDISGISGSAIAGGVDSAVVSSIVSSYVESSVSGKADQSALDDCCSAMSSVVSAKADSSALSSYAYNSAVSGKLDASASSQFYLTSNPSGFLTSQVVTAVAGDYGFVTSINGSGLSGQGGGSTPSYTETQLIINSSNMTASTSTAGITIGVKVPVQIVSNSSQATGVNIVYIVTG